MGFLYIHEKKMEKRVRFCVRPFALRLIYVTVPITIPQKHNCVHNIFTSNNFCGVNIIKCLWCLRCSKTTMCSAPICKVYYDVIKRQIYATCLKESKSCCQTFPYISNWLTAERSWRLSFPHKRYICIMANA